MRASLTFLLPWLLPVAALDLKSLYRGKLVPPIDDADLTRPSFEKAGINTTGTALFDQMLDHDDPGKGTFQQRYWWNSEFWGGPGSPVVLTTPGEAAAGNYTIFTTNASIMGLFGQAINGAAVMIEHRYWGDSSPYDTLTTENMKYLTLHQAIADLTYFAQTVDLPFDTDHSSNSDKAPWVLSGGSYSGCLAAWTESLAPGTFWAYHASSAPVEAIYDYWQYFVPVEQGMPKNCSKDISLVIDHVDDIFMNGNESEQTDLKSMFGLGGLQHNDDFGAAIEWGLWLWQNNKFYTNYSEFYQFCDAVEGVTAGQAEIPDEHGVGLDTALAGYANWFNNTMLPGYCQNFGHEDERDITCFDTYNPDNKMYTDLTVQNFANRQWTWMLCNEPFGWYQDGAPENRTTLVSRLVTADYWQRQCGIYFPEENGVTFASNDTSITADSVNTQTQGWNFENTTRLIWINGEFDPWKTATVSSEFRPGGSLASTPEHPVQIIPGGFHHSDTRAMDGVFNEGAQKVIDNEVAQIVEWVAQYKGEYVALGSPEGYFS